MQLLREADGRRERSADRPTSDGRPLSSPFSVGPALLPPSLLPAIQGQADGRTHGTDGRAAKAQWQCAAKCRSADTPKTGLGSGGGGF